MKMHFYKTYFHCRDVMGNCPRTGYGCPGPSAAVGVWPRCPGPDSDQLRATT